MINMKDFKVVYDSTDHFDIICCDDICNVIKIKTDKRQYDGPTKPAMKCTYITIKCRKCKKIGIRKIYWKNDSYPNGLGPGVIDWEKKYYEFVEAHAPSIKE